MRKLKVKNIKTPRCILRRPQISDAYFMYHNWASDPEVTKYLNWDPHQSIGVSELLIKVWLSNNNYKSLNWIIESKNNEVIGSISLFNLNKKTKMCEIGYCLSRPYWNKGIMTECLGYLLAYLFKKRIKIVTAYLQKENIRSLKVLTKNYFKYVDECEIPLYKNKKKVLLLKYQITRKEWKGYKLYEKYS